MNLLKCDFCKKEFESCNKAAVCECGHVAEIKPIEKKEIIVEVDEEVQNDG